MRRNAKASAATGRVTLAILVSLATVGAVPTSVLADSKAANGNRPVTTSPELNQLTTDEVTYGDDKPSNPQKRGVNPLLYREAELRNDFSGNSIPQNGVWEDVEVPLQSLPYPMEMFDAVGEPGPPFEHGAHGARTYDVLQSLLNRPSAYNPLLVGSTGGEGFPALRLHTGGRSSYGERRKRTSSVGPALGGKPHSHSMRLKRNSPSKLSPAEVFSLLALMDSRNQYRPLPPLSDYATDSGNDVLGYAPSNGLYPDVSFPMALDQLLGGRTSAGGMPQDAYAYEDAGEWMNSWTDPSVDYLGLPMADLDALGSFHDGKSFGSANGYLPQKRFMVAKKKRSVPQVAKPVPVAPGCKAGDASCGSFQHGTIQAAA
ncbi:uncharacterized protein LOC131293106 [Anopheles ziemanni]|uniref:uncharacterized protein LOC131265487 n=1 Tax=Anopheles coustani TaxID=139045 RepID=UPI002659FB4C|nr:uncharacterized protein LOC131265487 [Anopheles coustani]XP_058177167.1 uncharacterized protein LOC131293106 [Anopheles ziemanni]